MRTLNMSFPGLITRLIRRMRQAPPNLPENFTMAEFGRFMKEETFLYSAGYARGRVVVHGRENLLDAAGQTGAVAAFMHYGSFFLIGGAIRAQLGLPYTAIASRRNLEIAPEPDKKFWYGVHGRSGRLYSRPLFYTDESPRLPLSWLEQPGNVLGIVLDVREHGQKYRENTYDFLGRKIYLQSGPARLACIAGVPIVPVTICYCQKERRHHLFFDKPVLPDRDPVAMTQRLLDVLGARVMLAPEQQFYDIASILSQPAA